MVDKRKSLSKHVPISAGGVGDPPLTFCLPYLLGPELILPSPMSAVQTMPVYSISRSYSSLNCASPFITGCSSFVDSIAPFDLSLVPPNFGLSHTESGVVEDLSIRLTTQSVFPS